MQIQHERNNTEVHIMTNENQLNLQAPAINTTPTVRMQLYHQSPATVWFTGLSGSGKSTLAAALENRLLSTRQMCYILDGDLVRYGLSEDLGFSDEDRAENIRRIAEVAHLMNEAGLIVIVAAISPYQKDRETARRIIGDHRFVEVHVSTPLAICESRDPSGLYRLARSGGIHGFTGIESIYEPPLKPNLKLDTSSLCVQSCVEIVLDVLSPVIIMPHVVGQSEAAIETD
jgi:adenylyl-sulfate kinase